LRRTRSGLLWLAACVAALMVVACSGGSTGANPTPAPGQPTPTPTTVAARPSASVLYIAHTAGLGVSLRDACRDDARIPGGLAEGTQVSAIPDSPAGACDGWTLVAASGEPNSWVRNEYLDAQRPPTVSGPATGASAAPSGGVPPPAPAPRTPTIRAIVYGPYYIPLSELYRQTASWTQTAAGTIVGCTTDYWQSKTATVTATSGALVKNPDQAHCGFGRVSDVSIVDVPAG
jgi:hypothetical protein